MNRLEKLKYRRLKGFSRYKIYENGLIFSQKTNKFLKQVVSKYGYYRVILFNDSKKPVNTSVHRAVLMSFKPMKLIKHLHAAHLDGNKLNNKIENLKWSTPKENMEHKKLHGKYHIGETHPRSKLTDKQRLDIFNRYKLINRTKSNAKSIGLEYGITRKHVVNIVNLIRARHE